MLANHNPSDHEANRAARLVCKMIEEAKLFEGKDGRPLTYNDIHRTTEPEFKSTRTGPATDWMDWYEKWQKQNREAQEARTPNYDDYFKNSPFSSEQRENWVNGEWNFTREETKKKREHKRYLQCKTCSRMKETIFQGAAELFECNPCQWTAYQRSQQK